MVLLLTKRKIQVPQQVPGCPSCLLTSCVQMYLLGWGRGMVTEEAVFLDGKGKGQCILGWPAHTNLLVLNSGTSAWLSAVSYLLLPASLAPPGALALLWHTKIWSWFPYSSSRNVNSNIVAIPFPLHMYHAHYTQLTLALGMSLTLWGLLMYPPVYLCLTSATDKRGGFTHESRDRGT